MKLRHPWLIRLASFITGLVLRVWLATLRVRIRSADGRQHPTDPAVDRFIYAFWHETLLAPAKMRTKAQIMISQSRDGEFIAQVCHHLGIGVVRGSSSRDGATGLLDMLRDGDGLHLALTPDGPRGPRRKVQSGVALLASCTGLPVIPVGVGFTRAWRAGSWDRFAVPWPFSSIVCGLGGPIAVPQPLDRGRLAQVRVQVETAMLEATQAAESWAQQLVAKKEKTSPSYDASGSTRDAA